MTGSAPLIELSHITRVFEAEGGEPVRALNGVSLLIRAGEFVCITGPSGSGKSTLAHILGCLDRPTEGSYRFRGRDVARLDDDELARLRRDWFGFVFQSYHLVETASARENVALPAIYAAAGGPARNKRSMALLDSLGMGGKTEFRPAELSGGEQQRVAIGRALMNGGRVILADEPTGALDSARGREIVAVLRGLADRGATVIVVSHDRTVAGEASRRIELRDGRVVADSGPWPTAAAADGVSAALPPFPGRTATLWSMVGCAVQTIRKRTFHSVLNVLSATLGIAFATTLSVLVEGAFERFAKNVASLGAEIVTVSGRIEGIRLTLDDVEAIRREVADVRRVVARHSEDVTVQHGEKSIQVNMAAVGDSALPRVLGEAYAVETGSYLTDRDLDEGPEVVVLSRPLRNALFPPETDPIGETVVVKGVPFLVKGILGVHSVESLPYRRQHWDWKLYMPLSAYMAVFGPPQEGLRLRVHTADPDRAYEAGERLSDLIARRHGATPYIHVHAEDLALWRTTKTLGYLVLGSVVVIALTFCGWSIMAVMLASVAQRKQEIGIRLAVGARSRDIARQFLAEATVTSLAGAVLGWLLGVAAGLAISAAFPSEPPPVPQPTERLVLPVAFAVWMAPATLFYAVAMGVLSAIVPARRAAKVDPARILME
ncbi:MAG: ATP-binding cassette domain-containing protein [Gammaproteobacteria bacterium]|nr:ATP-binding cassette domain-containing protein [Gammaproteobacteria bacterium]